MTIKKTGHDFSLNIIRTENFSPPKSGSKKIAAGPGDRANLSRKAREQSRVNATSPAPSSPQQLEKIAHRLYAEDDRNFPSSATYLGIHKYDDKLESFTPKELAAAQKTYAGLAKELNRVNYSVLSNRQKAEYKMVKAHLAEQDDFFSVSKEWETDPSFYPETAIDSVYSLLSKDFAPLEVRGEAAVARLKQIPRLLEQGKANLKNPAALHTQMAIELVEGSEDFFNQLIPEIAQQSPQVGKELLKAKDTAFEAMQDYGDFLQKDLLPRSRGDFAIGEAAFTRKLQEEHLMPYTAQDLWQIGHQLFDQTETKLNALAEKEYPGKSWREVMDLIGENHPPKDKLVETYQQAAKKVRAFVAEKDLVDFPAGENLEVIPTPVFLRNTTPYAAYLNPAPYEKGDKGQFWVTPVNEKLAPEEQDAVLREQPYADINYTVSHEAYPGHHLQLSWQTGLKSDILKRSHSNLMIEGWAFYCEDMMKDQGYLGGEGEFCQLRAQLWRAARIFLDAGLHSGKLNFEQAVDILVDKVGLARPNAEAEVKRYTANPTQPMTYYMGKLEIMKLKEQMMKENPGMSLKEFHHKLLDCGSMQPSLVPLYYGMKENPASRRS